MGTAAAREAVPQSWRGSRRTRRRTLGTATRVGRENGARRRRGGTREASSDRSATLIRSDRAGRDIVAAQSTFLESNVVERTESGGFRRDDVHDAFGDGAAIH